MCNTTIDNEHLKNSFKDFINYYFLKEDNKVNDKLPAYCREERQYALFLYNKLLRIAESESGLKDDIDKKVLTACRLTEEDKILSVYYEVAFMRDFLHKEKGNANSEFNNELYKYIKSKIDSDTNLKWLNDSNEVNKLFYYILADYKNELKENPFNINNYNNKYEARSNVNYGSNVKDSVNDKGVEVDTLPYYIRILMRAMMNSKADIGIIYLGKDNNYHLKFIECKYESDESDVRLLPLKKDDLIKYPFVLRQTVIQYFICEFICNIICKEKLYDKKFTADSPIIVSFEKINDNGKRKELPEYFYKLDKEIITSFIDIKNIVPAYLSNPFFNNL